MKVQQSYRSPIQSNLLSRSVHNPTDVSWALPALHEGGNLKQLVQVSDQAGNIAEGLSCVRQSCALNLRASDSPQ